MSLVRYNTSGSGDLTDLEKQLTVVYRSKHSDEVVLFNLDSNDFEVVKIEKPKRSNKYPTETNDFNTTNDDRRRNSGIDTPRFVCRACGALNDSMSQQMNEQDNHENEHALGKPLVNAYDFTTTSSGDLIRGDYFKLLWNSMMKNKNKNSMLTIADDNIDEQFELNSISEKIINQGYFEKFFKILSKLGSGSYGSVYKVEHELLGLNLGVFALKKIPIGDDVNNLKKILNEVKFLYDLSCNITENNHNNNNVVKYNHVWIEIDQVSRFSPKIPVVFLLFEYCAGGTLEEFVNSIIEPKFSLIEEKILRRKKIKHSKKGRLLNDFEIYKIFSDITHGLNYLHNLKILHRDLKPSNCLFKSELDSSYRPPTNIREAEQIPTLLVSDFGESIMVTSIEDKWENNLQSTGATGTLEFCAPEILRTRKEFGKSGTFSYASDVYSLGMILYYLCYGKLPFASDTQDPDEVSEQILSSELFKNLYELRKNGPDELLEDWVVLIEAMVNPDPLARPNTDQILEVLDAIRSKLISRFEDSNMVDEDEEIQSKENDSIYNELDVLEDVDDDRLSQTGHIKMWMLFALNFLLHYGYRTEVLFNLQFLIIGAYISNFKPIMRVIYLEIILTLVTLLYSIYKAM